MHHIFIRRHLARVAVSLGLTLDSPGLESQLQCNGYVVLSTPQLKTHSSTRRLCYRQLASVRSDGRSWPDSQTILGKSPHGGGLLLVSYMSGHLSMPNR
eukprot:5287133-Amphidinium_carterae.1